ncbi:hypothetical protein QTP88_019433 [Uroleucon formosanum]
MYGGGLGRADGPMRSRHPASSDTYEKKRVMTDGERSLLLVITDGSCREQINQQNDPIPPPPLDGYQYTTRANDSQTTATSSVGDTTSGTERRIYFGSPPFVFFFSLMRSGDIDRSVSDK